MNDLDNHPDIKLINRMKMLLVLAGIAAFLFLAGTAFGILFYSIVGCGK